MPVRSTFPMLLTLALVAAACGGEPGAATSETDVQPEAAQRPTPNLPPTIVAERSGFMPEGIEYDNTNGRILVGSLAEGSIFQIHADGRVTPVVTDDELVTSVGIEVDEERGRLLVANSDRSIFAGTRPGQAKLGVYDLTSGKRLAMVDLAATVTPTPDGAMFYANDIAVGSDGTAYVTDSRMHVVYRVTPSYEASVLYRFPVSPHGPNGIVYHDAGYLLVGAGNTLYKIPVNAPETATPVTLPEEIAEEVAKDALAGFDGLVWTSDGRLAVVSSAQHRVVALSSADDWATAQLAGVAPFEVMVTTAATVGDAIYLLHPHFKGEAPPSVERVVFE